MKSCDEMVNSLLCRREKFFTEKKRKRKIYMRAAASAFCVCLVAVSVFGVSRNLTILPNGNEVGGYVKPDDKKNNENYAVDYIVVNSVSDSSPNKNGICLWADDFISMTREETFEYYGVNYLPEVPSDLTMREGGNCGIYRRDGGTGEVYFDTDSVSWSNVGDTRELTVEVKKGGYPFLCFAFDETAEKSVINNNEVLIGKTESGSFNALFMYKNIGFFVSADGLSQDEFVSVIASVVK